MPALRIIAVVMTLASGVLPSLAETSEETITRWYAMLIAANEDGLAKVLADNAVIKLEDIGRTQSKTEFLGTMSEWRIAIAGGGIRHKVVKAEGDATTVLACYDFAENDILMREIFRLEGGLIVENVQSRVAEDCSAY